jgi:hypothetical protein
MDIQMPKKMALKLLLQLEKAVLCSIDGRILIEEKKSV